MVIDKMNKQSFQTFLYAPYLLANYFNETEGDTVRLNVIGNGPKGAKMDTAAQFSISEDQQYGMLQ